MKSKMQLLIVLTLALVVPQLLRAQATSRVIPFNNVATTIAPSTPAQPLVIQIWDASVGGNQVFNEAQTLDVDVNGNISFILGAQTPGGLDPSKFASGTSLFLDVVNAANTSVLPSGRLPLNAVPFALSPGPTGPAGPAGPQGIAGPKGDHGPPGPVASVTAGNTSISIGGSVANPTVAVAAGGITNANVADGALSATKIAGTAAILGGSNTFGGTQFFVGPTFPQAKLTNTGLGTDKTVLLDMQNGNIIPTLWRQGVGGSGNGLGLTSGQFYIEKCCGEVKLLVLPNGNVGIGTFTPIAKLHALNGASGVSLGNGNAIVGECNTGGCAGVVGSAFNGQAGLLGVANGANSFAVQGIASNGALAGSFTGTVQMSVLSILGGADVAERFEVNAPETASAETHKNPIAPGMIVSIDPHHPGSLIVSSKAYDRRAAGVISGAGGVKPGMLMGQSGSVADGDQPVALAGRVYCLADATNGSIEPGDLLTTSSNPGHAMKVTDHRRAKGAIIGKAMTELTHGQGFVLVLMSLQ